MSDDRQSAYQVFPGAESTYFWGFVSLPFVGRDLILGDVWRFIFPGGKSTYFHGDVVSWIVGMVVEYSEQIGSGFPGGDCSFIPMGDLVGRYDVVDVLPVVSVGG